MIDRKGGKEEERKDAQQIPICPFSHSILTSCIHGPDSVIGAGDTAVPQTDPSLKELIDELRHQTVNHQTN